MLPQYLADPTYIIVNHDEYTWTTEYITLKGFVIRHTEYQDLYATEFLTASSGRYYRVVTTYE